ncbi:MAG: hypothetical protein NTZ05_08225 [Chloroflexi bacterium]|nr:hypothetical protein [Chloroflexota bacterium]
MNVVYWCPTCGHSEAPSQSGPLENDDDADLAAGADDDAPLRAADPLIERMRAALALFEQVQAAGAGSRECPACGAEMAMFDPSDLL